MREAITRWGGRVGLPGHWHGRLRHRGLLLLYGFDTHELFRRSLPHALARAGSPDREPAFDRHRSRSKRQQLLIPLATSADNEQEHNALYLQETGAAVALAKDTATPEGLRISVAPLLSSPGTRQQMAQQARSLGRPDAADRLAAVLLDVATG
ncbi:glycosyltransferase [Streptomyces viridochromogenes]|uniref:glycosyltransferase n=1 Tax=Streptomyces viridochromogenes TaxID=1938 RepID=UPI00099634CD|nr:glycosyltransferase [Streptomyces viridochromogenes]